MLIVANRGDWPDEGIAKKAGMVYVSRTHPGVSVFKPVSHEQLVRGWQGFKGLLAYTQALAGWKPSWSL